VAEKITDPLIQILRNAVAHGIEPPTERVLRGKPPSARSRSRRAPRATWW
jgi:two-component system chemotaxis sensor kinase CheA